MTSQALPQGVQALKEKAIRENHLAMAALLAPDDWSRIWPPQDVIPLWPDTPPGWSSGYMPPDLPPDWPAPLLRRIAKPALNVFRPAESNGAALLVCPGGSYVLVSAQLEGVDVARRFTAMGFTVFVLSYRLPGEGWIDRADVPLQDAQRAMRLIRSRADAFGVRPDHIGVLGFSAGGHLAATLAVGHAEPVYRPIDAVDRESARPDQVGLVYPVILLEGPHAHVGSRDQLLGPLASPDLIARRSPERHVTASTPPCFIAHGCDDASVPVENGMALLAALRAAQVGCEAHFFAQGAHGFGMGDPAQSNALWPQLYADWIRRPASP